MKFTRDLSAEEISQIRSLLANHPMHKLYLEAALDALDGDGPDIRRYHLTPEGGLLQVIDFDTISIFTSHGPLGPEDLACIAHHAGRVELHLEDRHVEHVRSLLGKRIEAEKRLRYYGTAIGADMAADPRCRRLVRADLDVVRRFVASHYPGTIFSDWMLAQPFVGLFEAGRLVTMGGTVTEDLQNQCCSLGNFLTAPTARGRGFAKAACRSLLAVLYERGNRLATLATTADNIAAWRAYQAVGFTLIEERAQIDVASDVGR